MTCPHHANFEQSLRNRGRWLLENDAALKAVQSFLGSKFWEAYERENSEDFDAFLIEIEDHVLLLCRVVASLRQAEQFWLSEPPEPVE